MTPVLGEQVLSAVIDTLAVGLAVIGRNGRVLHWNAWLTAHSGIAATDASQRGLGEIFPEIAGTRLEQAIDLAIRNRLPSLLSPALNGELLPLHRTTADRLQQRRIQQLIHVIPLRDAGEAACMVQITDVTANISRERRLREQADSLRRRTTQDPLTGLLNRHAFEAALHRLCTETRHRAETIALLMIDLDHFDAVNTAYGSEAGDAILAGIGRILRDNIRPDGDIAARYSGEKFAVLLPGIHAATACLKADNLRQAIANLSADTNSCNELNIARQGHSKQPLDTLDLTASIGLAIITPSEESDTHALLSAADVALYQAKLEGCNQAIYFSVDDGSFLNCATSLA